MVRRVLFLVLVLQGLSACQADKQTIANSIRITPTHYEVNELKFLTASEAVNQELDKNTTQINIRACAAMPTQRVIDLMAELRNRYKGHVFLGTTEVSCVS